MIVLPADWPGMRPDGTFDHDRMKDERNWWPFRWLKQVARLPSTLNTFVGVGHTVPNGEGPDPFADGTGLACMLISLPLLAPRSRQLVVNDNVTVHFLTLVPLYPAEMQLKLDRGFGPLIDLLEPAGVTELIQPNRPDLTAL